MNGPAARAALAGCLVLASLAVSACAPRAAVQGPPPLPPAPHPSTAGPSVAAVRRAGRLRVAADLSVPPMAFRDESGPKGFDVDLVELIAEALGVRAEIVDTPVAAMRGGFPADADLAAGALTAGMAPGLASSAYGETSPVIVWGPSTRGTDLRALRGRRVAAALGSPGERLARQAGAALVGTYLPEQSLTAVAQGRADAAIVEAPEALDFAAGDPASGAASGARLRTTPAGGPAVPLVLVVRPGADDLAAYVSAVIQDLRAQGGLDQLRRRWHL